MDCLFCKIIAGDVRAEVVYRDDVAYAVMDIHPRSPGHAFVIPKKHYVTLSDVPDAEMGAVFVAVRNVAEKIRKALAPDGFTIGINHGRDSGQEIDHLHIHIMPRYKGDGGGSAQSVVNNPPIESIGAIAEKIRGSS